MKHRLLIFGLAAIVTFVTVAIAFPAGVVPSTPPSQLSAPPVSPQSGPPLLVPSPGPNDKSTVPPVPPPSGRVLDAGMASTDSTTSLPNNNASMVDADLLGPPPTNASLADSLTKNPAGGNSASPLPAAGPGSNMTDLAGPDGGGLNLNATASLSGLSGSAKKAPLGLKSNVTMSADLDDLDEGSEDDLDEPMPATKGNSTIPSTYSSALGSKQMNATSLPVDLPANLNATSAPLPLGSGPGEGMNATSLPMDTMGEPKNATSLPLDTIGGPKNGTMLPPNASVTGNGEPEGPAADLNPASAPIGPKTNMTASALPDKDEFAAPDAKDSDSPPPALDKHVPPPPESDKKDKGKGPGKADMPVLPSTNVTVLSTGSAAAGVPLLTHSELADVDAPSKTIKSSKNNNATDSALPGDKAALPGDKGSPSLSDPVFDNSKAPLPPPAKDGPDSTAPGPLPPAPDATKTPPPEPTPALSDDDTPLFSSAAGVGHWDNVQAAQESPFMVANDTLFSFERLSSYEPSSYENRYRALDDFRGTFDVPKHWGHLSPYFSSPMFPEMQERKVLPQQCNLKQVHMLHRNGAHMPAKDSPASRFAEAIDNVTMGSSVTLNATGPLAFLNHWKYELGVGHLTAAGAQQMFDSGVQSFYRYGALFNASKLASKPVLRTTSQHRMVDSASHWALGMYGLHAPSTVNLEVIVEDDGYNNTLADSSNCPNANDEALQFGDQTSSKWIKTYLKGAVNRLSRHLPKMHLTPELAYGMQTLCAHETFTLGESNFCHLFTMKEWEGFEYASDLLQRGNYAFGSPTARAQSLGYLVELLARIEEKAPSNSILPLPLPPSLNKTLDDDTSTFPVDQPIHVDFTHQSNILHLLTALNFSFLDAVKLTEDSLVQKRAFYASHIVPFAARLVFEVIDCPTSGKHSQSYIRTLLNDAILPMGSAQGCSLGPASSSSSSSHKQSAARKDGLCPLDDFLAFFKDEVIMENWGQEAQVACHGRNGTDFVIPASGPNNGTVSLL